MRQGGVKRVSFGRIRVARVPGPTHRGVLLAGPLRIPCALGPAGIVRAKREGDGATPAGRFRLRRLMYRADRIGRPPAALPMRSVRRDDGWCDDPASGCYNRAVRLPFRPSHERMWRSDGLYDIVIELDHNRSPRIAGHGSAVFFHLAHRDLAATAGCVAIRADDMRRLLPRLSASTRLVIG